MSEIIPYEVFYPKIWVPQNAYDRFRIAITCKDYFGTYLDEAKGNKHKTLESWFTVFDYKRRWIVSDCYRLRIFPHLIDCCRDCLMFGGYPEMGKINYPHPKDVTLLCDKHYKEEILRIKKIK